MNYACVLILNTRQTYGNQGKKLLYKVITYVEKQTFLVPYQIKYEFSKKQKDKYVLIRVDTNENVTAIIETIGDVDDEHAYSIYMYYATCNKNGIYDFSSIVFQSNKANISSTSLPFLPTTTQETMVNQKTEVITIDNQGTIYHDDAISVSEEQEVGNEYVTINVYITHICHLLDESTWEIVKRRLCSIYLPHHRKDMLPKHILQTGDLQQGEVHSCVIVSFRKKVTGEILSITDTVNNVYISKNYIYEEPALLNDTKYQLLKEMSPPEWQTTSKQVIAYWAIQTNSYFAKKYNTYPFLYTTTTQTPTTATQTPTTATHPLPPAPTTADLWLNKYTNEPAAPTTEYIQFSSPLRRYVDLYNQWVYIHQGATPPPTMQPKIEDLNMHMGNIRKLENTTKLIHYFYKEWNKREHPDGSGILREGEVVNCEFNEEKKKYKIIIYIPQDSFFAYAKAENAYELGEKVWCKFFLFEHAHHYRNQKIKCCISYENATFKSA